jgi:hypothetical protein
LPQNGRDISTHFINLWYFMVLSIYSVGQGGEIAQTMYAHMNK